MSAPAAGPPAPPPAPPAAPKAPAAAPPPAAKPPSAPPPSAPPPPPPPSAGAAPSAPGAGNTQLIQVIGGVIIGVGIVTLLYKYVYADRPDKTPVDGANKLEPIETTQLENTEPEKPKETEWPCLPKQLFEPCEERKRRFSLDGALCYWRHWIGVLGKQV